jgi:carboxypeptidase C (cathepsin A)
MNTRFAAVSLAALLSLSVGAVADVEKTHHDAAKGQFFKPESSTSEGTVSVEGNSIDYHAVAGTLVVHQKGYDDSLQKPDGDGDKSDAADKDKKNASDDNNPNAEASMFYVAYFKDGAPHRSRPITFVYNGGPGSASMWLHMGAFGPRRVVTADNTHTPAAPYSLVDNAYSLMDASDLVFVDAPGTGFGRIAGKDKEKAFYGTDPDVHAFAEFITQFLSVYDRWNSPKYLFGESYGTPRSAALVNALETQYDTDFNGVILLSQILNYDLSTGRADFNPGVDLPFELALPTYAATAWYHHKLPNYTGPVEPLIEEVKHFALNDYALALQAGADLSAADRDRIAAKLHDYTGLPIDYIEKANLRIDGGEFEKNLQDDEGLTTGRLDSRFSGPDLDPLSEKAEYDPQSAAISSAYVSGFNAYVRDTLHFGEGKTYRPSAQGSNRSWDFHHQPPGVPFAIPQSMNVMPDLANAMKYNPGLKVQLNAGYYDLATPFFEGIYEMNHLQIPPNLQSNISFKFYQSGHMVYAHEEALKQLHDNVAEFIRETDNVRGE